MESENPFSKIIDASIFLALLTALIYLSDYCYQDYRYQLFKIPANLIAVDTESILDYSVNMILAVFILLFSSIAVAEIFIYRYPALKNGKIIIIAMMVMLVSFIMHKLQDFNIDFFVAILIATVIADLMIFPFFALAKYLLDKIMLRIRPEKKPPTPLGEFLRLLLDSRATFLAFFALFIATPGLSTLECNMDYKSKTEYFVTGNNK